MNVWMDRPAWPLSRLNTQTFEQILERVSCSIFENACQSVLYGSCPIFSGNLAGHLAVANALILKLRDVYFFDHDYA